jgi:hypothetical protein
MGEEGFLNSNLLVIGLLVLVVFGYALMIIRKRWKDKFLHPGSKGDQKP